MRVNSEFVSNEIDESELHFEKHFEQRISWHGIVIDVISASSNPQSPIRVTRSVVVSGGKRDKVWTWGLKWPDLRDVDRWAHECHFAASRDWSTRAGHVRNDGVGECLLAANEQTFRKQEINPSIPIEVHSIEWRFYSLVLWCDDCFKTKFRRSEEAKLVEGRNDVFSRIVWEEAATIWDLPEIESKTLNSQRGSQNKRHYAVYI
jgi:hypothetical protein